jgi:hypothetical protein
VPFHSLFTVEVLLAGNYLPSSHPGFRKEIPLMKHFEGGVFTISLFSDNDTLDIIIESVSSSEE